MNVIDLMQQRKQKSIVKIFAYDRDNPLIQTNVLEDENLKTTLLDKGTKMQYRRTSYLLLEVPWTRLYLLASEYKLKQSCSLSIIEICI